MTRIRFYWLISSLPTLAALLYLNAIKYLWKKFSVNVNSIKKIENPIKIFEVDFEIV